MMQIWRSGILAMILWWGVSIPPVKSETERSPEANTSCPQDVQQLTALLLKDLPGYSNRVIQRTQSAHRQQGIRTFIITASPAEFEPLALPHIQYHSLEGQQPKQVFFTVLEKQYSKQKIATLQTFHWLFLAPTDDGWRLVMMFSRVGTTPNQKTPTPPQETTNGIIGQGVQLWLRDCRAGRI